MPTRGMMRRGAEGAGFRVVEQPLVLRLPASFALPSILTLSERP